MVDTTTHTILLKMLRARIERRQPEAENKVSPKSEKTSKTRKKEIEKETRKTSQKKKKKEKKKQRVCSLLNEMTILSFYTLLWYQCRIVTLLLLL